MRKQRMYKLTTLTLALCSLLASTADARWGDYLTTKMWSSQPGVGCPEGGVENFSTPGRPAGGWYEWRFNSDTSELDQFFYLNTATQDVTRLCPRTFNEYTSMHYHGTRKASFATHRGRLFTVYDSIGGYYGLQAIKLQEDPSTAPIPLSGTWSPTPTPSNAETGASATTRRPYALEIVRNVRNYANLNPASFNYDWRFSSRDGNAAVKCTNALTNPNAFVDDLWEDNSGVDHEGTQCGIPGQVQATDPHMNIRSEVGGKTTIVWTERVVETTGLVTMGGPLQKGIDTRYPVTQSPLPTWYPYRSFRVFVQQMNSDDLLGVHENSTTGRTPSTPLDTTLGGHGLNNDQTNDSYNAFSPRVTQIKQGPNYNPVVAWGEGWWDHFSDDFDTKAYYINAAYTQRIWVRMYNGTDWSPQTNLGTTCNIQLFSSGKASGRQRNAGGVHDIATIKDGAGNERPIIVMNEMSGACKLRVKQWNGTSWDLVGGDDLNVQPGTSMAAFPSITVVDNVPYISWADKHGTAQRDVYVARYNATSATWDRLGDGQWHSTASNDSAIGGAASPSVAAKPVGTSLDDGADVFVSVSENEPGTLNATQPGDGVWGVTVRKCRTRLVAGKWDCVAPPELYAEKARVESGAYVQADYLGVTGGVATMGLAGSPAVPQFTGYTVPTGPSTPTGPRAYYVPSVTPGTTSLVTDGGDNLWLGWTGPIENHRKSDMGVYARLDAPVTAEKARFALGTSHTLATYGNDGNVYAWGSNAQGQLGDGTGQNAPSVRRIALGGPVKKIAAGGDSSAAIANGTLRVWGSNDVGQLGTGDWAQRNAPASIVGTWSDVALGRDFIVALNSDGLVFTGGSNTVGQTGLQNGWPLGLTHNGVIATAVFAGADFACALRVDAVLVCWGNNAYGQLGRGTVGSFSATPTAISLTRGVLGVALGEGFAAVLSDEAAPGGGRRLYTWGRNNQGQLANRTSGDATNSGMPTYVGTGSGLLEGGGVDIEATTSTLYVRTQQSATYAVGGNERGQVGYYSAGTASAIFRNLRTTLRVSGGSTAKHELMTDALDTFRASISLFCVGANDSQQCTTPVAVSGPTGATASTADRTGVVSVKNPFTMCYADADCGDDGLFCNGEIKCVNNVCQAPTAPPCGGSTPSCIEATRQCVQCQTSAECSDRNVCNGTETCSANNTCVAGTPLVCSASETCNATQGCMLNANYLFVTSTTTSSGAIASTADASCAAAARVGTKTRALGGRSWRAVLAIPPSVTNPPLLFGGKDIYNVNGVKVAAAVNSLPSSLLATLVNENGAASTGPVWSGYSGTTPSTTNCSNFTSAGGTVISPTYGTIGNPAARTGTWISSGTQKCNVAARIYCISQ